VVSNRHWESDWRNLEKINLKKMYSVRKWDSMVKMVHAHRADFTLAPFRSAPHRILSDGDINLVPIPNISFVLEGSRHWVVSKKHRLGKKVYKLLSQGMINLRNQGTIARAYRESGFFQRENDYWPTLNRVTALKSNPVRTTDG